MKVRYLCKRKYKTIGIIVAIAIIFFLLQFFSLNRLSVWNRRIPEYTLEDIGNIDDGETFAKELAIVEAKIEKDDRESKSLLTGVHLKDLEVYKPDKQGMFTCLITKVKIEYSNLNDDYCDCADSSDEPGTNACPHSKFYCKYQMPDEDPLFITGSKVNDGICDCCDGSDEWANHKVPDNIRIVDNSKTYSVSHTPCVNICQNDVRNKAQEQRVLRMGLKLRQNYLSAAKHLGTDANYGPENVFFLLSEKCFDLKVYQYEYKICPFKSITQDEFPHSSFNLGRNPVWKSLERRNYVLLMKDGDNRLCPGGNARITKIRFFCGLQDLPLTIKEEETCVYILKFTTPAAC
ncbi:hypothetical protein SNE40_021511 [Patella caerulea]|uniref:Glucosidase 2 subunit beta n=1 Tax=Patella caerulea TaxID=87958 RepID=A0AAN8FZU2_PATCE